MYLATTVAIARNPHVSIAEFGEYQWVLAFAMIAQLVADSGLPRMMIREIAKDPQCVGKIAGVAAALIWAISLVVCLLVGIVALFLPYHAEVKIALLLMTFATLATFHAAGYSAVLRAFEDNELNYLGFILQKILLFAFILVMLHFRTGLTRLCYCPPGFKRVTVELLPHPCLPLLHQSEAAGGFAALERTVSDRSPDGRRSHAPTTGIEH